MATFFSDPKRAESVRHRFVTHSGKIDLEVIMDEIDWPKFAETMVEMVGEHSDGTLREALSPAG